MSKRLGSFAFLVSGLIGLACGSSEGTQTAAVPAPPPDEQPAPKAPPAKPPAAVDAGDGLDACATSRTVAESVPLYLVVFLDKSGSMGWDPIDMVDNTSERWTPVTSALESFFETATADTNASLQFFPLDAADAVRCEATNYATMPVAMTQLPDNTAFKAAIGATTPKGSTPTLAALKAGLTYAEQVRNDLATQKKSGKVVMVMATDGSPYGCGAANTLEASAKEAQAVAHMVPTYVIGVGPKLQQLDTIAQAGGTTSAILVPVTNPTQTATDFRHALDNIRGHAISCSYALPKLKPGEVLDPTRVNVTSTPAGGLPGVMPYDQNCSGGAGWRYDDPNSPTRIELCDVSCESVQKEGAIDVVVGCKTVPANQR